MHSFMHLTNLACTSSYQLYIYSSYFEVKSRTQLRQRLFYPELSSVEATNFFKGKIFEKKENFPSPGVAGAEDSL